MKFKKYMVFAFLMGIVGQQVQAEGFFTSAWNWTKNTSEQIMNNPQLSTAISAVATGVIAKGSFNRLAKSFRAYRSNKKVGTIANLMGFLGLGALSVNMGQQIYPNVQTYYGPYWKKAQTAIGDFIQEEKDKTNS